MIRLQAKHALPALLFSLTTIASAEDWPEPIAATMVHGVEIVGRFDAPAGLQGFAGKLNGQGMALYLTADEQHVLVGTLLDANGQDISRVYVDELVNEPMAMGMWEQLEASDWIGDGADDADQVIYTFTDPNCPFCSRFWKQARPWVESGKVQLRHIMVGILREDSAGKSAAILGADNPAAALHQHETGTSVQALDEIPEEIKQQLKTNHDLMNQLGVQATPAIFYLDEQGRMQQQVGAPRPDRLVDIMGTQQP